MYVFCKDKLPMDVDFMVVDTLEVSILLRGVPRLTITLQALRPKLVLFKSFEDAATAVDEMVNTVMGSTAAPVDDADGDSDGGDDALSGRDDGWACELGVSTMSSKAKPSRKQIRSHHAELLVSWGVLAFGRFSKTLSTKPKSSASLAVEH